MIKIAPANVHNIYLYRAYLDERVIAFRDLKRDFVYEMSNQKEGRLRHLSVANGLLRETASLQRQSDSVLKCKVKWYKKRESRVTFINAKHFYNSIIWMIVILQLHFLHIE